MTEEDKYKAIGVDIGGTKISAGMIAADGKVSGRPVTVPTGATEDKESIIARITGVIESLIKNEGMNISRIKGIGLGVTGPLDIVTGTILECPQLPSLHFYPLKEKISGHFGLPVSMDNDANTFILGEGIWGAGKDHRIVLGYTLGTGLGCALVIDQRLFTGANGMAGEVWPSPYGTGTIEDIVSGNGISSIYERMTQQRLPAKEISELAAGGDQDARKAFDEFGEALATAVAWGINMIDPDIVVLGGSIANSFQYFESALNENIKKYICPVPAKKTRIVKAKFGDQAGFIGAAGLVFRGNS